MAMRPSVVLRRPLVGNITNGNFVHSQQMMFAISEEYLRAYHAVDANILALFGPLETTTTTTTTTTPAPTTTTREIDAILADEDDDYSSDYDDDYEYGYDHTGIDRKPKRFDAATRCKCKCTTVRTSCTINRSNGIRALSLTDVL